MNSGFVFRSLQHGLAVLLFGLVSLSCTESRKVIRPPLPVPSVIDTHVHLWDPTRPEGIDWPDENFPRIHRPILPAEFLEVARRNGVTGAIVVEASGRIEDNHWILDLVEDHPDFFRGFVGHLAVGTPAFAENLARLSADPRFRGIRMRSLPENGLDEAAFADLALLAENKLSLDLLIRNVSLADAATIAERLPQLTIVLDHVAGAHHQGQAMSAEWTAGVRRAASFSNVNCKVSGLFEHSWEIPAPKDPAHYLPALEVVQEAFGEDRLIFGSNWPVIRHGEGTYDELLSILATAFAASDPAAVEKLFSKNAERVYGLSTP